MIDKCRDAGELPIGPVVAEDPLNIISCFGKGDIFDKLVKILVLIAQIPFIRVLRPAVVCGKNEHQIVLELSLELA